MQRQIVDRFMLSARNALENGNARVETSHRDIVTIACDPALSHRFRQVFNEINDPDLKTNILSYITNIADDLEDGSERTDVKVDLLDRAALPPTVSVTAGGIAALAGGTADSAAPLLLLGGIIGLTVSALGRTYLRSRAQQAKAEARKLKLLKDSLK